MAEATPGAQGAAGAAPGPPGAARAGARGDAEHQGRGAGVACA